MVVFLEGYPIVIDNYLIAGGKALELCLIVAVAHQAGVVVAEHLVIGIEFHFCHLKLYVGGCGPSFAGFQLEIYIVAIGYGVECVITTYGVIEEGELPGIDAFVYLYNLLVGIELAAFYISKPLVRTHMHSLVGVDDGRRGAGGTAVPCVGRGVGVEIQGVVDHFAAERRTEHPVFRFTATGYAPKRAVAPCYRFLALLFMAIVGIGKQFGAAEGVICLCGLHAVISIGHIHLQHIGIEWIAGHSHAGVNDAGTHLSPHYGVDLILLVVENHFSRR